MTILGLDISTSTVGWCLIREDDGTIIKIDSIDLKNKKKFPDLFSKASYVQKELKTIESIYSPLYVYIEPALSMFQMGKSSAKTISTLLKFNGIVSWMCHDIFGFPPEFIPAISARKICGITIPKGEKAKKVVMKFLIDTEPDFAKLVNHTKKGNVEPKYFDQADALIIAKAGFAKNKKNS